MPTDASVPILWTGGWDSTYRLLVVLLDLGAPVQPWYLLDAKRASAQMETQAMDRMRAWLAEHHPATRETLLPTRIVRLDEVGHDAQIEQAFAKVLRLRGIGDQYAFLARFVKQFGVQGIELSLEKTTHGAHGVIQDYVGPARDAHGHEHVSREGRMPRHADRHDFRRIFATAVQHREVGNRRAYRATRLERCHGDDVVLSYARGRTACRAASAIRASTRSRMASRGVFRASAARCPNSTERRYSRCAEKLDNCCVGSGPKADTSRPQFAHRDGGFANLTNLADDAALSSKRLRPLS